MHFEPKSTVRSEDSSAHANDYKPYSSDVQFLAFSMHFEPKSTVRSEDNSAHANLGAQGLQTLQLSCSIPRIFPPLLNPKVIAG